MVKYASVALSLSHFPFPPISQTPVLLVPLLLVLKNLVDHTVVPATTIFLVTSGVQNGGYEYGTIPLKLIWPYLMKKLKGEKKKSGMSNKNLRSLEH